ncbi:MAG: hypothetical protein KDB27_19880, partial [Planctomycetales bacterium]|nr:hypothetical protein [Planctomycetales bacterium]
PFLIDRLATAAPPGCFHLYLINGSSSVLTACQFDDTFLSTGPTFAVNRHSPLDSGLFGLIIVKMAGLCGLRMH